MLIAWYKLDGNANDSSGNGYNGTWAGTPAYTTGKIGQAATCSFSGTNFLYVSNSTISWPKSTFSISLWVNPTSIATGGAFTGGVLASKGSWYGVGWHLGIDWNTLRFSVGVQNALLIDVSNINSILTVGSWHHVVYTFTTIGSTSYAVGYIDGVQKVSGSSAAVDPTCTNNFYIGCGYNYFEGSIDDVKVYNHALSPKEIRELSKAKVLHYDFDSFQEPTTNLWNQKYEWHLPADSSNTPLSFSISNPPASSSYTLSSRQRFFSDDGTTTPRLYLIVNYSDGTNTQAGNYSIVKDNMWHDYSITVNATAGKTVTSLTGWVLDHSGVIGSKHLDVEWIQIEAKDHTTPFVNGSRTGIVRDISGYGNDATLAVATTPQWVSSDNKMGRGSYKFWSSNTYMVNDGDYIQSTATNLLSPNDFTISYWTYRTEVGIGGGSYFKVGAYISQGIDTYDNNAYIFSTSGTQLGNINVNVSLNTWVHNVITLNGTSLKYYVNGALSSSTTITSGVVSAPDYPLVIGYSGAGGVPRSFNGYMDDVRIYATALSATDIAELYQNRAQIDNNGNFYSIEFLEHDDYQIDTLEYDTGSYIESSFLITDLL